MTNRQDPKPDATYLAIAGLGFLSLALFFLWRDLALPPELILLGVAALAALAASLGQPRGAAAVVAPATLLAATLVGGAWFAADPRPPLLWGLVVTLAGSIAAVIHVERRAATTATTATTTMTAMTAMTSATSAIASAPSPSARVSWYAAGLAFLVTSRSLYFHFLTTGVAPDAPARRLVLTILWLSVGLALLVADRHRRSATLHVGIAILAAALIKAVAYDTTHLHGGLRVLVLAAVGALLLAGARVLRKDRAPTAHPAQREQPAPGRG